mmetsp:Transcript_73090/g.208278  ORF Transcript_73090/g.208278 Transcript_73090/m.208278 type:complete len:216 (+) Transcript_73090:21-668(+)
MDSIQRGSGPLRTHRPRSPPLAPSAPPAPASNRPPPRVPPYSLVSVLSCPLQTPRPRPPSRPRPVRLPSPGPRHRQSQRRSWRHRPSLRSRFRRPRTASSVASARRSASGAGGWPRSRPRQATRRADRRADWRSSSRLAPPPWRRRPSLGSRRPRARQAERSTTKIRRRSSAHPPRARDLGSHRHRRPSAADSFRHNGTRTDLPRLCACAHGARC